MNTSRQYCFTDDRGKDIYLFTLRHAAGTVVNITNYGAIITAFKVADKNGVLNDIVLGFDKVEDYLDPAYLEQYPWFGAAVGRYANRIGRGEFSIGEKKYTLSRNRNGNNLHGGVTGFDKKTWTLVETGDQPHPYLTLSLDSKNGEEGFPGNLHVQIRYELRENELSYSFTATTDEPTPVNLTHHSYFNLDDGKGTIHDHELCIPASFILEQFPDLVVTGNKIPVEKTPYDFRQFKKIGEGLKQVPEFDQSFILDKAISGTVAQVRSARSGLLLELFSSEPVVHFYSGKWTPAVTGKNKLQYGPFSGFCLETHQYPNAVNIPHFPDTILQPGNVYRHDTTYRVSNF